MISGLSEGKLWPTYIAYSKAETLLHQQSSVWSRLWFFLWSCMDVRVGLWRKLSAENWCFWSVVLEKTLEKSLDCKEVQPVHPKGDQSWVFIETANAKAEALVLWPPDLKSWLIGKDPDPGRDWGQEEKGTTGWDGWMASPTWWTWFWVDSGSWWCHPAISFSVVPFSSCPHPSQDQGLFQWVNSSDQVAKVLELQL